MAQTEEPSNPADELASDIDAAIEQQEKGLDSGAVDEVSAEVPESVDASPERDERGRFKPKVETEAVEVAPESAGKITEPKEPESAPELGAVVQRPPPGFSVASKAEWDNLPQHVRDDIAKREQEIDAGFRRYSGLGRFAEQAERNGTTLQNAVSDYVAVENELNKNFFGGIEYLCQRMAGRLNVHPRDLLQAIGQRYSNGQQAPAEAPAPSTQVDPQAIAEYAANVVRTEFQQKKIDSDIDTFAADPKNKYFHNLRQDMAIIVQSGKATNLQEAYEAACWLNPEIRQTLVNEVNGGANKQAAATVNKARAAAKAIGGSPSDGINPDRAGKRQKQSIDADIDAAIAAQEDAA